MHCVVRFDSTWFIHIKVKTIAVNFNIKINVVAAEHSRQSDKRIERGRNRGKSAYNY